MSQRGLLLTEVFVIWRDPVTRRNPISSGATVPAFMPLFIDSSFPHFLQVHMAIRLCTKFFRLRTPTS